MKQTANARLQTTGEGGSSHALLLQRKCACGNHTNGAECQKCTRQGSDLRGSSVGNHQAAFVPPLVHDVLRSSGQALNAETRSSFESRFDHDFSHVRVHTGTMAAKSARAVQAQAYTVGSHIVFGAGRYSPASQAGQKLIAHELTHVVQRAPGLQRAADPDAVKEFDERVTKLRTNTAFIKAAKNSATKKELEEIIKEARTRDNALYYIEKLELLFNTPEATKDKRDFLGEVAAEAATETTRLATAEGAARKDVEESVSKDPTRVFSKRKGQDGTTFLIDARDPTNIAVQAKVRPVAKGAAKPTDVSNLKQLQDAIEKNSSTQGYSVDLEFVDKPGPDVFTVGMDQDWPTSGNWVSTAQALSHELHHLLGLDDLYDYIEAHAKNPNMKIPDRIHWFREQLKKTPDPSAGISIMGKSTTGGKNLPSNQDVCRVTGATGTDFDDCVKKRADALRNKLQPAISDASITAFRAFQLLSNIKPAGPADDPALQDLKQRRAAGIAANVFGASLQMKAVTDRVDDMRWAVALPNVFLVSELNPQCSKTAFVVPIAPRIRLCPAFLGLSTRDQADLLLREAAHFVGATDGTADSPCSSKSCSDTCGGSNNGEAWGQFVRCVSKI